MGMRREVYKEKFVKISSKPAQQKLRNRKRQFGENAFKASRGKKTEEDYPGQTAISRPK